MFVPRRTLLKLAAMKENTFKTLQRRNQLPFPETTYHDDAGKAVHPSDADGYPHYWATLLWVAEMLANKTKLDREQIKQLVAQNHNELTQATQMARAGEHGVSLVVFSTHDGPSVNLVPVEQLLDLFKSETLMAGPITGFQSINVAHELHELIERYDAVKNHRPIPDPTPNPAFARRDLEKLKEFRAQLDNLQKKAIENAFKGTEWE